MGAGDSIKMCLRNLLEFSSRAAHSEFWWFASAVLICTVTLFWWDAYFPINQNGHIQDRGIWKVIPLASLLLSSVGVRRCHDTGRSGAYFLIPLACSAMLVVGIASQYISFNWGETTGGSHSVFSWTGVQSTALLLLSMFIIPCLWIALAIVALLPSQPGSNKYGPNPTEVSS
jgi:uncharacterized membrane protein YhaH (DUF805 family)